MKIGIIGAGRMGRALGRRWARGGHEVTISFSRDQRKLEAIAREIGHGARSASPADAVKGAEAVLFAVQWSAIDEALEQARSLAGITVLTCTLQSHRCGRVAHRAISRAIRASRRAARLRAESWRDARISYRSAWELVSRRTAARLIAIRPSAQPRTKSPTE